MLCIFGILNSAQLWTHLTAEPARPKLTTVCTSPHNPEKRSTIIKLMGNTCRGECQGFYLSECVCCAANRAVQLLIAKKVILFLLAQ